MTNRQSAAILALLAALYAAGGVLLAPLHFIIPGTASGRLSMTAAGAALAPPTFLALWAVFGRQRAAMRLPLTLWLLAVLYLSLAYGELRVWGQIDAGSILLLGVVGLAAYMTMLLPLWMLRVIRRWRLEKTDISCSPTPNNYSAQAVAVSTSSQFTIRAMLGWTLAAASIFAGVRWILPDGGFDASDLSGSILDVGFQGLVIAAGGLPVLSVAWIVLADGRRTILRLVLAVITLIGMAGTAAFWWWERNDSEVFELVVLIEAGVLVAGLASCAVVRTCGYRLVRRGRHAPPLSGVAAPLGLPQRWRRFACTLSMLAAAAVALACYAPTRFEIWRQAEVSQQWAALGWETNSVAESRIHTLRCNGPRALTDADIRRMDELADLKALDFSHSLLSDGQLGQLPLSLCQRLNSLNLDGTQVSDAALAHITRFPNLTHLNLSRTNITDAGLPRLGAFKRLKRLELSLTDVSDAAIGTLSQLDDLDSIDLQLTAVTQSGAAQLRTALPNTTVMVGASDALLAQALVVTVRSQSGGSIGISRLPLKFKRLHAQGSYPCRVRAGRGSPLTTAVKGVTDAGLALLSDQAILEELDLRGAVVTDAGLPPLFKLTTLKRIDLRDTMVTEQGRQRLARAVPNCEILR